MPSTVVRGVCGQALTLPELPAHWAGCWGPPPTCCGRGRVAVGAQHCPLGLHALWGLRAAGGWGAVPGGLACHRCEGRLVSGAVPSPAARPLGRAAGVLRPVCPGCGRCGRGTQHRPHSVRTCGPTLLAVGSAEGRSRGAAFHRCEGRLRSGAPPPPTARPLGGQFGSATHVLWARVCGSGGPTLSPWPACPVGAACRGGCGGPSPGGWPATVVRGVWCQALSLSRPPVLWGGQPGIRDPCVPGCGRCGRRTQHPPHSVRPCGPALLAVGVAEWHSRGGLFHRCEARLWSGAPPPRTARPLGGLLGSATHMLWARPCGCGGPTLSPWPACPVGAACRGGGGGPSPGGVACHRCEGRLVSGAVPPPAARLLGRAAGVPRPVCPGCSRCGRVDPAPALQRAPLRAGVARCGGGGRASPGGCLPPL